DLGSANMGFSLCTGLKPGAVEALKPHGAPDLQKAWLPKLVTGEWTGTMNLTEPQAGSDVGALKTRAVPAGDGSYRITGQKIFITYGEHDLAGNIVHLVLARLPDAPAGTRGISLFLVPKILADGSRNDLRCVSIEHKLGIHASPTCVMAYGDNGGATGSLTYYTAGQTDRASLGDAAARARADLLTPLVKAYGTDVGVEVTSLAVQVHGGMGYIEETGAAQHYRDARISPIYEGTNGIQAADLVGRKLSMDGGGVLFALLDEVKADAAGETALMMLVADCETVARHLLDAGPDDRLAGSYPFLTMLSTAVAGWLLARQVTALADHDGDPAFAAMKRAAARFYFDQIVPEARGLKAAAMASAEILYSVDEAALSAA